MTKNDPIFLKRRERMGRPTKWVGVSIRDRRLFFDTHFPRNIR